jgi:hypothetical protein
MEVTGCPVAARKDSRTREVKENPVVDRPDSRIDVKDEPVTSRANDRNFTTADDNDGGFLSLLVLLEVAVLQTLKLVQEVVLLNIGRFLEAVVSWADNLVSNKSGNLRFAAGELELNVPIIVDNGFVSGTIKASPTDNLIGLKNTPRQEVNAATVAGEAAIIIDIIKWKQPAIRQLLARPARRPFVVIFFLLHSFSLFQSIFGVCFLY